MRGASSTNGPAARVVGHTTHAPAADESLDSYDSREPLNEAAAHIQSHEVPPKINEKGLSPGDVNVAMHYLDTLHHATHWLKQHELERSKKQFKHRLHVIKSCAYMPVLAEVSSSKRSRMNSFENYVNANTAREQSELDLEHRIPDANEQSFSFARNDSMRASAGFVSPPLPQEDQDHVVALQVGEFWVVVVEETCPASPASFGKQFAGKFQDLHVFSRRDAIKKPTHKY